MLGCCFLGDTFPPCFLGGPYWIKCGRDGLYLKVDDYLLKKETKENASKFWIIKTEKAKSFAMGYRIQDDRDYQYVKLHRCRSVQVNSHGSPTRFHLNHKTEHKDDLSIARWRNKYCSVQLAERPNLLYSYLGFDSNHTIGMKTKKCQETFLLEKVPVELAVNGTGQCWLV